MAGQLPLGFDPDSFDTLWEALGVWLLGQDERCLALPGHVYQRHTAYPRAHALLRLVDIEKLPAFFESHGFEPGSRVAPSILGSSLDGFPRLSRDAWKALQDSRRDAIVAQVAGELEGWDGSSTDTFGGRKATVQLLLQFQGSRPVLQFMPRRSTLFPDTFEDGDRVFEDGDPGFYEPVPVSPDDNDLLSHGFIWNCRGFALSRSATQVIPLSQAGELSGLLSQRGLPLGGKSAVLCVGDQEGEVSSYLAEITGRQCRSIEHAALPTGWRLFRDVVPSVMCDPPDGLEMLEVSATVTVRLQGGLRLGRGAVWLVGAPPTVLISGPPGLLVEVDGERCMVVDGSVDAPALALVGTHVVQIGRLRRKIEVRVAEIAIDRCLALVDDREIAPSEPVALPPGAWVLIGQVPDEVFCASPSSRPTLVRCPFIPTWAVDIRRSRGKKRVLCLADSPNAPQVSHLKRSTRNAQSWMSTIRTAQVSHPTLEWLVSEDPSRDLNAAWRAYWEAAKSLKRRLRTTNQ